MSRTREQRRDLWDSNKALSQMPPPRRNPLKTGDNQRTAAQPRPARSLPVENEMEILLFLYSDNKILQNIKAPELDYFRRCVTSSKTPLLCAEKAQLSTCKAW